MDTRELRTDLTIDDLPGDVAGGPRHELIDGSLYVTPMADLRHQEIVGILQVSLSRRAPAEWVVLPGANVIHDEHNLVIPDVVVAARHVIRQGGLGLAPRDLLLAVEVESPSTRRRDRALKTEVYGEWGVRHVWLVDPVEQVVRRSGQSEPGWLDRTLYEVFGEQLSEQ